MPSTGDQGRRAPPFTEVATTCSHLTFGRGCRRACPFVILRKRRVCARPAPDSDPVRRHGPERGSTGGGGRPRSFPSGPPLREAKRRAGRAEDGRPGKARPASNVDIVSDVDAAPSSPEIRRASRAMMISGDFDFYRKAFAADAGKAG